MNEVGFLVEVPDGELEFRTAGSAADFLLDHGFANAEREPHWHLRWGLDRLAPGESFDAGPARVLCQRPRI